MKKMRVVLVIVMVLLSCFSLCSCRFLFGSDDDSSNDTAVEDVYLGETAKNSDGVEFTVVSIWDTQQIGYFNTTENNYAVIKIRISNKGKEPWNQSPNNCVLILNGAEYEYSSATFSLNDSMSSASEINPNITKTMSIAFETPTKLSEDNYSIKLSGYSFWSDNSVTIKLQERPN